MLDGKFRFMEFREIKRHDGKLYLLRLYIFETPWFGMMLHRFYDSDDTCLHDHPWWFISLILIGGYWEHKWLYRGYGLTGKKWFPAGSMLFRRADWSHRLEIKEPGKTLSLVIHGPHKRVWGFWDKTRSWIPWTTYKHAQHCT